MDNTESQDIRNLIEQWIQPLYGFALQKTGRMDDAEELAGRMVEGLYVSLLRSGIPDFPPAYVWRLARNHWARWLRDRSRQPGQVCFDETGHSPTGHHDLVDGLVQKETMGLLRREIAWLSRIQRQVVIGHYFESRPVADLAQELGLPAGTVKWHLSAARKELKEGMETMRSVGQLGMQPIEFTGGLWLNGDPGEEKLNNYASRRISQNVIYACYHQDRTIDEIAAELGISPVFVEDEIRSLVDFGILEPLKAGRYRAWICLTEWKKDLIQRISALYREHAPLIARELVYPLLEKEAACAASGVMYPDQDWNTLLWTLVLLAMEGVHYSDSNWIDMEPFRRKRPDGGNYLIGSKIVPPFASGEDTGCLSDRYSMNGAMHHNADELLEGFNSPQWYSFRMDTWWTRRSISIWSRMKQEYSFMVRHLRGELSPEYNVDEYRALLDLQFLRREGSSFVNNIVVVPNGKAAEELFALFPRVSPALKQTMHDFDKAWLDIMLPVFPEHIRPMARGQFGQASSSSTMTAYILEHLLQTGRMGELRPEHRLSSQIMLFMDCPKGYWDLLGCSAV